MTLEDEINQRIAERLRAAGTESIRGHTAYHEAAHALVGVLLGEELVSTTMTPKGQTTFKAPNGPDSILAHAKIALAGTNGEALGMGGSHPDGPRNDFPQAVDLLKRLGPGRPRAQDLVPEVQQILLENEPALHRIAKALLGENTLTENRVKELIKEAR